MLNFRIDPAVLAPHVPAGCELDTFAGRTYVTVVGFRFLHTRVLGVPVPFHGDFNEVNLRFYVRRFSDGAWRRGVVFIKEIAPRRAVEWVARLVYRENYVTLPLRHRNGGRSDADALALSYEWRRDGAWEGAFAECSGRPEFPADGSLEAFIVEHYWGYTRRGPTITSEYRVDHPRWMVRPCTSAELRCDVCGIYGPEFAAALSRPSEAAFVADGSPVTLYCGQRLPAGLASPR
jgi:uncharacterized protein YqjF (DUF2071 family)